MLSPKPILAVSLRVDPAHEADFNHFYHHEYIPNLLDVVPEIVAAWRYEEYGTAGSLRWFTKRFLTIYEVATDDLLEVAVGALERPGRESQRAEWNRYRELALRDVKRIGYLPTYVHPRATWDGEFGSRPFFLVTVEVNPDRESEFRRWYEGEYLPKIMADVPTWAACRRYTSVDRQPVHYQTVYEAHSLGDLEESFALMRAPHRYSNNADWEKWAQSAIVRQEASSFRPIFRTPG